MWLMIDASEENFEYFHSDIRINSTVEKQRFYQYKINNSRFLGVQGMKISVAE
jgi:hypothetical protein